MRRQNIERLEPALDDLERPLQIRQDAARELIDEEGPARLERGPSLADDVGAQRFGHGAEGDPGDDVARGAESELAQDAVHIRRRALHDVQSRIGERGPQELDEVAVRLDGDEMSIGAQVPQDLRGDAADARTVLHDDPRAAPVYRLEDLFDEET